MLNDKMISHQRAKPSVCLCVCEGWCVRITEGKSPDTSMCICSHGGGLWHAVCRESLETRCCSATVTLRRQGGNMAGCLHTSPHLDKWGKKKRALDITAVLGVEQE